MDGTESASSSSSSSSLSSTSSSSDSASSSPPSSSFSPPAWPPVKSSFRNHVGFLSRPTYWLHWRSIVEIRFCTVSTQSATSLALLSFALIADVLLAFCSDSSIPCFRPVSVFFSWRGSSVFVVPVVAVVVVDVDVVDVVVVAVIVGVVVVIFVTVPVGPTWAVVVVAVAVVVGVVVAVVWEAPCRWPRAALC